MSTKKLHDACRKSCGISIKMPTFAAIMDECIQPHYLHNGEVRSCDSFDVQLINEGASVYEVVRLMDTKLLFLEDHLRRLFSSMKMAGLHPVPDEDNIRSDLQVLISNNPVREGNVKIVLNAKSDGSNHFLVYFVEHRYPSEPDYKNGVRVITFTFERKDPNKKIWRPEFRKRVAERLEQTSAYEVLLTDTRGFILEASKANIFAVSRGTLLTPPDDMILPGITRNCIMKICKKLGIPMNFQKLDLNDVPQYDAVFLTGTSTKVLPVSQINELSIPKDSTILRQVSRQYDREIQKYLTQINQT